MEKEGMKKFVYEGQEFSINSSERVNTVGDIDEQQKMVLIDKDVPEKFHECIAVHELVERKHLKAGHSYVFAHNKAQKAELSFLEEKHGKEAALALLNEEESLILKIARYRVRTKLPEKPKIPDTLPQPAPPVSAVALNQAQQAALAAQTPTNGTEFEITFVRQIVYNGKKYVIDNSYRLIGCLVDLYENKKIIFIDCDVPERFFEGLALYIIEERNQLKQGCGWREAGKKANDKEKAYYEKQYGKEMAEQIFSEEAELQKRKYSEEQRSLKAGEHKMVYSQKELPK